MNQLTSAPSTFPVVATASSNQTGWESAGINATKTASDCAGISVAARKAARNSPRSASILSDGLGPATMQIINDKGVDVLRMSVQMWMIRGQIRVVMRHVHWVGCRP